MTPREPKSIKIATLAIIVMVVLTFIGGIIVLRWAYQSDKVLTIHNSPVPVQPPEIPDGGKVFLSVDFCKHQEARGTPEVFLVGEKGAKIAINWPKDNSEVGCSNDYPGAVPCGDKQSAKRCVLVPIPIPGQAPTDTYKVTFDTCYNLNPFKNPCTHFESKAFRVINKSIKPGDAQSP